MITPAPLKEGDLIAIASPAGAIRERALVEQAAQILRSKGFLVEIAPHCLTRNGYYSGTREERMGDLALLLSRDDVKAILCSYGGYGSVHLIEEFSPLISKHPKWLVGMSDISALHAACLACGVQSLHAPQCRHIATLPDDSTTRWLIDILKGEKPRYQIPSHSLNIKGETTGTLAGGNLSVITTLCG